MNLWRRRLKMVATIIALIKIAYYTPVVDAGIGRKLRKLRPDG